MKFIFRMATRNLFRQVGRNSLSMVSIVLGVFIMVVGAGFANGLDENAIRGQIDEAGHVEMVPVDYPVNGLDHPLDGLFPLESDDAQWLDSHTVAWTSRVVLAPRLIKGRDSARVRLIGYDTVEDEKMFSRKDWQLKGEMPESHPLGFIVSDGVADLLDLTVGDVVVVEARTADGALNAMQLTVTGIVHTGSMFFDRVGAMAPRKLVDELALSQGRQSHVAVRIQDRDETQAFAVAAESELGEGVEARTWQEETEMLVEAGEMRRSMFNMLGFALLAMAAAGIANTVLMAAFERVREIGTMRALGLNRAGVITMFAIEGMWLGLVGGVLGGILGGLLNWYFNQNGIDMMALMGAKGDAIDEFPVAAMLYLDFSPETIATYVGLAVVASVLASLYPAVIASRLLPADAVRAA